MNKPEPIILGWFIRIISLIINVVAYFHWKVDPRLLGFLHLAVETLTSWVNRAQVTPKNKPTLDQGTQVEIIKQTMAGPVKELKTI